MIFSMLVFCINHFSDITIETFLFLALIRWLVAPSDRRRTEILFAAGTAAFLAGAINVNGIRWMGRLLPSRYDLYAYNLDALLGAPGFSLGMLLYHHELTKMVVVAVYNNVVAFMLLAFIAHLYMGGDAKRVFVAFALNPLMALPLYMAFPVSGPVYAFGNAFPFHRPEALPAHTILLDAVPNGVPSVHISIALLVLWALWRWNWGKVVGFGFLSVTVVATLGLGEHYLLDLFAAVPYALIVLWATEQILAPRTSQAALPAGLPSPSDLR